MYYYDIATIRLVLVVAGEADVVCLRARPDHLRVYTDFLEATSLPRVQEHAHSLRYNEHTT